ncbi:MAG: hypothetical protein M4579_006518 [Chaenotheca gracillima]|nr:MAG: hypothetical protein M4579_006518 [Chaenotheca gracillima]
MQTPVEGPETWFQPLSPDEFEARRRCFLEENAIMIKTSPAGVLFPKYLFPEKREDDPQGTWDQQIARGLLNLSDERISDIISSNLEEMCRSINLELLPPEMAEKLKQKVKRIALSYPMSYFELSKTLALRLDSSESPTFVAKIAELEKKARRAYNRLIDMGGRPTHKPGKLWRLPTRDRRDHGMIRVLHFWRDEFVRLQGQSVNWSDFRNHQEGSRGSQDIFSLWVNEAEMLRKELHIDDEIELLFDQTEQTKITEWREYQLFIYSWSKKSEKRIYRARERVKHWQEQSEVGSMSNQFVASNNAVDQRNNLEVQEKGHGRTSRFLTWIIDQLPIIAAEDEPSREEKKRQIDAKSKTLAYFVATYPDPADEDPQVHERILRKLLGVERREQVNGEGQLLETDCWAFYEKSPSLMSWSQSSSESKQLEQEAQMCSELTSNIQELGRSPTACKSPLQALVRLGERSPVERGKTHGLLSVKQSPSKGLKRKATASSPVAEKQQAMRRSERIRSKIRKLGDPHTVVNTSLPQMRLGGPKTADAVSRTRLPAFRSLK